MYLEIKKTYKLPHASICKKVNQDCISLVWRQFTCVDFQVVNSIFIIQERALSEIKNRKRNGSNHL
jgi:hypothetical protein